MVLRAGTIERFEREVRINATLSHPNTVEIFDYGRTEDGTYYYVMEYLPGLSLADLVERHGPLPPGRAVYLLRQVCPGAPRGARGRADPPRHQAVEHLRRPARGRWTTWPSCSTSAWSGPWRRPPRRDPATRGKILGTPLYMSPEQATGARSLDARSDIYSLGAVAYYPADRVGRRSTKGPAIEAIIAHARDPVVPPSRFRDGVPADLEAVVLRCLAKDPAERYPDAGSLEVALGRCSVRIVLGQSSGQAVVERVGGSRNLITGYRDRVRTKFGTLML